MILLKKGRKAFFYWDEKSNSSNGNLKNDGKLILKTNLSLDSQAQQNEIFRLAKNSYRKEAILHGCFSCHLE